MAWNPGRGGHQGREETFPHTGQRAARLAPGKQIEGREGETLTCSKSSCFLDKVRVRPWMTQGELGWGPSA